MRRILRCRLRRQSKPWSHFRNLSHTADTDSSGLDNSTVPNQPNGCTLRVLERAGFVHTAKSHCGRFHHIGNRLQT